MEKIDSYNAAGGSSGRYYKRRMSPRVNGQLLLVPNPVIMIKTRNTYGPAMAAVEPAPLGWSDASSPGQLPAHVNRLTPDLYGRVFHRFSSKAWSDAQGMFAVDIAERQKTIDMIVKSVSKISNAVVALRRGKFYDVARHLGMSMPKEARKFGTSKWIRQWNKKRKIDKLRTVGNGGDMLADQWLAYRYGWTPLYGSIYSMVGFVMSELPKGKRVTAGDSEAYGKSGYLFHPVTGPRWSESGTNRVRIVAYVSAKADAIGGGFSGYNLNQLGLTNPAAILWELVPFSFVADWFAPIGPMLNDMGAFWGLSITNCSITYHTSDTIWRDSYNSESIPYVGTVVWREDVYTVSTIAKQRDLGVPPVPLFKFQNGLNPRRLGDALALLFSRVRT